jgi:hypothetical protein
MAFGAPTWISSTQCNKELTQMASAISASIRCQRDELETHAGPAAGTRMSTGAGRVGRRPGQWTGRCPRQISENYEVLRLEIISAFATLANTLHAHAN